MATAAIGAAGLWLPDRPAAILLALIALSAWPARQLLMPAINAATDAGAKGRFKRLHGLSVLITLTHIALAGVVLVRFA